MKTMPERIAFAKTSVTKAAKLSRKAVEQVLPKTATFAERERAWLAAGSEAMRLGLEAELQAISDGLGAEVLVDGVRCE